MENFDLAAFIKAAEELARADELLRAFDLLDNLPGYYRDNIPPEVLNLKRNILYRIQTTSDLVNSPAWESDHSSKMEMKETLRGIMLLREVKHLNDNGLTPFIIDYGPGDFWLPEILLDEGLKFNYEPICINRATFEKKNFYPRIPVEKNKSPKIFVACEIIEHLWDERELIAQSLKWGLPDCLHVSTPKFTFNTSVRHWSDIGDLGHLRTYTPTELLSLLSRNYPDYFMAAYDNRVMHVRLVQQNTEYTALQSTKTLDPFGLADYKKPGA